MRVIGTAGHVDHGKSTLVEALTGKHPDRLKEERAREMTIDLGFAFLTLPGGEQVGIVDVPGHRDFIENMLAGVGGVDAALFVIAADEGIMPQTREHLAILDILQVQGGVIALTKIDLVDDSEWLDLVEADIRKATSGTVLENAPIVRLSARTRQGLPDLLAALEVVLSASQPRPDLGRPRLPVDRVFSMPGFGTVVTGTLTGGVFRLGDEVEILPGGLRGRVRGIQSHNRREELATPGSRTALNLSGLEVDQVHRGCIISRPGQFVPTRRLDASFSLLKDVGPAVCHNMDVKLFINTQEVPARLRLLGTEELHPGESGWIQLEPANPVITVRGDRYILRRPSPGETLGGGMVLDPLPVGRHRRFSRQVIEQLEAYRKGSPFEVLQAALLAHGIVPAAALVKETGLEPGAAASGIQQLLNSGQAVALEPGDMLPMGNTLLASHAWLDEQSSRVTGAVAAYHAANPLRPGMPREELKSRLRLEGRIFAAILSWLARTAEIEEAGNLVRLPGYRIRFTPRQQADIDGVIRRFAASPYSPPSYKEVLADLGQELLEVILADGALVRVSPEVLFRKQEYQSMLKWVTSVLAGGGEGLTAAGFRDHFNTSRKYALAFLEHLDAAGITVRVGDYRKLKSAKIRD